MALTVVDYNRALLTNTVIPPIIDLFPFPGPTFILAFGLAVPIGLVSNFVELQATVGWQVALRGFPNQPTIQLTIRQDGVVVPVASVNQELIEDTDGSDLPLEMVTTFQAVLTNVLPGPHVYELFAENLQPAQGTISITGPATISGKLIG